MAESLGGFRYEAMAAMAESLGGFRYEAMAVMAESLGGFRYEALAVMAESLGGFRYGADASCSIGPNVADSGPVPDAVAISRMTIRLKLMMFVIGVILLANFLLSVVGVQYVGRIWLSAIQDRVRLDLGSAQAAYEHQLEAIATFLNAATLSESLAGLVSARPADSSGPHPGAVQVMDRVFLAAEMDFITLLDAEGRVLYRPANRGDAGDVLAGQPLVREALATRAPAAGTVLMSRGQLAVENPGLAERVRIEVRDTPAALPTADRVRDTGLVMAAVTPIRDIDEVVVGFLYGGILLNRRDRLVDEIRREVYFGEAFEGAPIGTVTIFLDDLRIATNVLDAEGRRAVGTRMSGPVYEEVIQRGRLWAAPAFVVNEWYITAYRPIENPQGEVIGSLYVGVRQAPFLHRRNRITQMFLAAVLVVTLLILVLLLLVTKWILGPISDVMRMCQRVIAGDLAARVDVRPWGEMGELCESVDRMAEAIEDREKRLTQSAQRQLVRSEKLASIGRLAAGIAHEINNPMTGVLTFAHLMRDRQPEDSEDREDLEMIIQQTERVAEIVRGLLDFARERAAIQEPLDINEVIRSIVRLVENQKEMRNVHIELDFAEPLPDVLGDANQLQQVFLNLMLNASQAMEGSGGLTIVTGFRDPEVVVTMEDTGIGIAEENLDRIFDPFFTTKPVGQGTGLGLSVTYGIVEQHGGTIEVESQVGMGTRFTIHLPVARLTAPGIAAADPGGENDPEGAQT